MTAAKYRYRVELQTLATVRDSSGQWSDDWVSERSLWAQKIPKGGKEYFEAKSVNAVRTVVWKARYQRDLERNGEGKRLFHDGIAYDIQSVVNIDGLKKELEIVTEAVVPGGS